MPTPTFDGDNLLIILPAASPVLDVRTDLYSEWKLWQLAGTNQKYPQAFTTEGGQDTVPGEVLGRAYFLRNDLGWRIRNAEEDAAVQFNGNFFATLSSLPIVVPVLGAFTVTNQIKFSSLAFVEQVAGGLTAAQQIQLDRAELVYKIFLNKGLTTDIGGGAKRIDFFDDDQSTIIDSVTISADGNTRTNP